MTSAFPWGYDCHRAEKAADEWLEARDKEEEEGDE